jgi:stearoyl-CoA desaturase (Delta-9 desaturase)
MYFITCALVFLAAYLLNALTITVGYHRGLAHGSVRLSPAVRRGLIVWGSWITGIDPKAWSVMHRMHHQHSDTPEDPHSPTNVGLLGIGLEQLRSYERVLRGLMRKEEKYTKHTQGLDFKLSWVNRTGRWYLPYVLHALVGAAFAGSGMWLLGVAYFAGMMSHPIQGGLVNAFGHAVGGRNFDTPDDSRNNWIVAVLILGEGLQNNHHRFPKSAKFSYHAWEPDAGFHACVLLEAIGVLTIDYERLIPTPAPMSTQRPALRRAA